MTVLSCDSCRVVRHWCRTLSHDTSTVVGGNPLKKLKDDSALGGGIALKESMLLNLMVAFVSLLNAVPAS